MLGTHYAIVYTNGRGEQRTCIDTQGDINKKRGGSGQGSAANAWGNHDTGSKSQSSCNLDNGERGKERLYRQRLVDKNKGDNYVVISLWLFTSLVVPYVMALTNLAFNKLLKMTELVR